MERTTEAQLKAQIAHLNKITNSPAESYSLGTDGKYHANVGNYHLDCAYGGYNLARIANDGGGITQPIGGGFKTKRELYNLIRAYISGIESK